MSLGDLCTFLSLQLASFKLFVFLVYVSGLVDLFTLQSLNCIHLNDYCVWCNVMCIFAEPVEPARQLQLLQHPTHTISFWFKKNLLQLSTSGTNLHIFNTAGCVSSFSSISWNYGGCSVLKSQLFISRILSIHFFLWGLFCKLLSN